LLLFWSFNHRLKSLLVGVIKGQSDTSSAWTILWKRRDEWLRGY
jgi:hypothetical protein